MPDRKKTPDILGDLLGASPSPGEEPAREPQEPEETSKTASQEAGKPAELARRPSKKASKEPEQPQTASSSEKVKATFYLSAETTEALEELQLRLRRLARPGDRGQISKSLIVEQAILLALEEIEARGAKSQIAVKTVKQ